MWHYQFLQLLDTIGAVKKDKKKKDKYEGAYQDSITAPLGHEHDDDVVGQLDGGDEDPDISESDPELHLMEVLSAIEKVCCQIMCETHHSF